MMDAVIFFALLSDEIQESGAIPVQGVVSFLLFIQLLLI
jgi:hypothetical protein